MNKKYLIAVVGPTAIGKTSLSIALAQNFNTDIISADSRQFFKEMSIGTAAPSKEELAAAPHHFIHHLTVGEDYSVGNFEKDALQKLDELFKCKPVVIMVGGSGLYVDAVTKGLDNFPKVDPKIRADLNQKLSTEGLAGLQNELHHLDPDYYAEADIKNPHRVIRALEICRGTGKPYSSFRKKENLERPFETLYVGLTADRQIVYDRINLRVDLMITQGLLHEVKNLYERRDLNALNTVGYKEIFRYLDGELSLEEAVEEIKKNTRRFAKRQYTWFRKNQNIHWFNHTTPFQEIFDFLQEKM
jgi:tRNA dimethylallyltransferase